MKKALQICATFLLVFLPGGASAEYVGLRYDLSPKELRLINDVAPHLDTKLQKQNVAELRERLQTGHRALGLLLAAILFRNDPTTYSPEVFEGFAVDDYARRANGDYNLVEHKDVRRIMGAIETRYSRLDDKRIFMLVAFLHYRDSNEWFMLQGHNVSIARFFRAAFLAAMLEDSSINPIDLANAIDRWTRDLAQP